MKHFFAWTGNAAFNAIFGWSLLAPDSYHSFYPAWIGWVGVFFAGFAILCAIFVVIGILIGEIDP